MKKTAKDAQSAIEYIRKYNQNDLTFCTSELCAKKVMCDRHISKCLDGYWISISDFYFPITGNCILEMKQRAGRKKNGKVQRKT